MWKALTLQVRSDGYCWATAWTLERKNVVKSCGSVNTFHLKCDSTRGSRDSLMLETSEQPVRGGDRKERTGRAGSDRKEVKTTSKNSLTNRPYSRYPRSLNASFRIDGIKAITSDISGGKQATTFGNTSNRRRVCLFYQNEKTILVLQNVQFEFRQVLRHYCLLNGHPRSLLHPRK